MEYTDIMHAAARVFNDRNPKYGDMKIGMERVALIANLITGLNLTAHEVALILHSVKLSRIGENPHDSDHYIDGINYLAFAGELIQDKSVATETEAANKAIDEGMANIAFKFSPQKIEQE